MFKKWLPFIACAFLSIIFTTRAVCQIDADTSLQNNDDSAAVDATIANFYQTLSFTSADQNKYNTLPQLFTAQGVLISAVADKPFFWAVQQYAQMAEDNFKKQKMEVWGEQETC